MDYTVVEKAKKEGIPRLRKMTSFYEKSLDLINKIEEQKRRSEELKNRDMAVRAKHAKKIAKTAKKIGQLFNQINQSFLNKEIQEHEGKIFSKALRKAMNEGISTIKQPSCTTCHVQRLKALAGTTSEARELLSELDPLIIAYAGYKETRVQLDRKIKETRKEIAKTEEDINRKKHLEKLKDDVQEKSDLLDEYQKEKELLEQYTKDRNDYLEELKNKTALSLIELAQQKAFSNGFPKTKNEIHELKEILEKDLPGLTIPQVIQYSSFNDKKLGHFTPQPTKFKELVQENNEWLMAISKLEKSEFLEVNMETEKDRITEYTKFFSEKKPETARTLTQLAKIQVDPQKAKQVMNKKLKVESINQTQDPEEKLGELHDRLKEYEETKKRYFT